MRIAVAGKGGGGKTSFAALMIRELVAAGHTPVFAVDADANANLAEVLGFPVTETMAGVLAETVGDRRSRPEGMSKAEYLDFRVRQVLAKGPGINLLVMGGPEAPGCYCYVNNLLRGFIAQKAGDYSFLVIDNEPGLEHLSRRTTRQVDLLFVISDATVRGIRSAGRIHRLAGKLDLGIGRSCLVVNRVREGADQVLEPEIAATGLDVAGFLPFDPVAESWDLEGKPLVQLPGDTPLVSAVRRIVDRTVLAAE